MIMDNIIELSLFALYCLSLGSFVGLYTVRWPIQLKQLWAKEAHEYFHFAYQENDARFSSNIRSHCPKCKSQLAWYDLIPLWSYFLLKGQCRVCKRPISSRYWKIELLSFCLGFPLIFITHDLFELATLAIIINALLAAAIIDIEYGLIPDACSGLIICLSFIVNLNNGHLSDSVLGLLLGYFILYALREVYIRIRYIDPIGLGDVKLLAAIGAWLYVTNVFSVLLYASILGIFYAILMNKRGITGIPFAPCLTISAIANFYFTYI